jgi:uncharacterized phage protein (TIGR02218 family)
MRTIDPLLQASLDGGATTLCRCWLLIRRDGERLAFTDHDEDVAFGGDVYAASTGLTAAALEQGAGLAVDNGQAAGALQSAGLTEADIAAGLYDGARVEQWLVDWTAPAQRLRLFSGSLGEITRTGAAFQVELRGLTEELNRPVGRAYLRDCDASFGDQRCGVDAGAPAYSATAIVSSASGVRQFTSAGLSGYAPGWFERGRIEWLAGENAGAITAVKSDRLAAGGRQIELWEEAARAIRPGDSFRIVAGCDKLATTCQTKFNNFINFRGFPHIPGEDWANSYAREGERHDGSSLYR